MPGAEIVASLCFLVAIIGLGWIFPVRLWASRAGRALKAKRVRKALPPGEAAAEMAAERGRLPAERGRLVAKCEHAAHEIERCVDAALDYVAVAERSQIGRWLASAGTSERPSIEFLRRLHERQSTVTDVLALLDDQLHALCAGDEREAAHFEDASAGFRAEYRAYLHVTDDASLSVPTRVQTRAQILQLERIRGTIVTLAERAHVVSASPYRGS